MKRLTPTTCVVMLAWLIVGCASVPQQLNPDLFYRRDLPFCVENLGCYEGVMVLPRQPTYAIEVAPKGDANIDLLLATTCHREDTFEKTSSGWFVFASKKRFKYFYTPIPGIEDDGLCALMLNTYEKDKGRHAWSFIKFEHPRFELAASLSCNGVIKTFHGVSVCQSKAGLTQRIIFPEPVMIEADPGCPVPKRQGNGYEWAVKKGECGYTFRGQSGRLHDLTALGYEGVLVRDEK